MAVSSNIYLFLHGSIFSLHASIACVHESPWTILSLYSTGFWLIADDPDKLFTLMRILTRSENLIEVKN